MNFAKPRDSHLLVWLVFVSNNDVTPGGPPHFCQSNRCSPRGFVGDRWAMILSIKQPKMRDSIRVCTPIFGLLSINKETTCVSLTSTQLFDVEMTGCQSIILLGIPVSHTHVGFFFFWHVEVTSCQSLADDSRSSCQKHVNQKHFDREFRPFLSYCSIISLLF